MHPSKYQEVPVKEARQERITSLSPACMHTTDIWLASEKQHVDLRWASEPARLLTHMQLIYREILY